MARINKDSELAKMHGTIKNDGVYRWEVRHFKSGRVGLYMIRNSPRKSKPSKMEKANRLIFGQAARIVREQQANGDKRSYKTIWKEVYKSLRENQE